MHKNIILKLFILVLLMTSASVADAQLQQDPTSIKLFQSEGSPRIHVHTDSIAQGDSISSDSIEGCNETKVSSIDSMEVQLYIKIYQLPWPDSIHYSFRSRADSLKDVYSEHLATIDSVKTSLRKQLDSLTALSLPTHGISQRLDSLSNIREKTLTDAEKKLQSLKDQTSSKLKKLDLPSAESDKLRSITEKIEDVKVSGTELNLRTNDLKSPLTDVDEIRKLGNLDSGNSLPSGLADPIKNADGLPEVNVITGSAEKISQVTEITGQVTEHSKQAQEVVKGNLDINNISATAEEKARQMSGIKEMESQASLDKYQTMSEQAQNPDSLKEVVVNKVRQVAVNHFAGKQKQLKAAMEEMSKYKNKYSNLNDIREATKKQVNEMRGKPFIERLIPGIALQIQKEGGNMLIDFNRYAGYRFTGRLQAGIGWNQRIGYSIRRYAFSPDSRIFGPRAYGEFKL